MHTSAKIMRELKKQEYTVLANIGKNPITRRIERLFVSHVYFTNLLLSHVERDTQREYTCAEQMNY